MIGAIILTAPQKYAYPTEWLHSRSTALQNCQWRQPKTAGHEWGFCKGSFASVADTGVLDSSFAKGTQINE